MSKRYAVLDKDGLVINHILIADPVPQGYWPGYGATLVPLEEVSTDIKPHTGLNIVLMSIKEIPQIGDRLNLETGEVTKFQPKLVEDEVTKELCSSAPEVKFVKDVDPATEPLKTVVDKTAVETKEPVKVAIKGGK